VKVSEWTNIKNRIYGKHVISSRIIVSLLRLW
jgi:hypothetical protein